MKKILLMLLALCILATGCMSTSTSFYAGREPVPVESGFVYAVVLKDGKRIVFDRDGGQYTTKAESADRVLTGTAIDRSAVEVPVQDILEVEVREHKVDATKIVAGVSATVLVAGILWVLQGFRHM